MSRSKFASISFKFDLINCLASSELLKKLNSFVKNLHIEMRCVMRLVSLASKHGYLLSSFLFINFKLRQAIAFENCKISLKPKYYKMLISQKIEHFNLKFQNTNKPGHFSESIRKQLSSFLKYLSNKPHHDSR